MSDSGRRGYSNSEERFGHINHPPTRFMNFKFFSIAALVAASASPVFAQFSCKMGFTSGGNYSTLRSDLFQTLSGRANATAGFTVRFGFGESVELNTDILYVQKGATAKVVQFRPEKAPCPGSYNFFYNSFEAGLTGGFKPVKSIPVYLQAGAFMGAHYHNLDRSHDEFYLGDYQDINKAIEAADLNEAFTGIDYGAVLGVGIGGGKFRFSARYYPGLRNLNRNRDFVDTSARITSNSCRAALTYYFR